MGASSSARTLGFHPEFMPPNTKEWSGARLVHDLCDFTMLKSRASRGAAHAGGARGVASRTYFLSSERSRPAGMRSDGRQRNYGGYVPATSSTADQRKAPAMSDQSSGCHPSSRKPSGEERRICPCQTDPPRGHSHPRSSSWLLWRKGRRVWPFCSTKLPPCSHTNPVCPMKAPCYLLPVTFNSPHLTALLALRYKDHNG